MQEQIQLTLIELYQREKQCKGYRKIVEKEVYTQLVCDKTKVMGGIKTVISGDGKPYTDRVQVSHDYLGPMLVKGTFEEIYNKIYNSGADKTIRGFYGKKG